MDNKPLEKQAENYIKSQLSRFSFKFHGELSFDENGSDLMITKKTSKQTLKFLTVQSKGRKLKKNGASVKIPFDYVVNNFILFVYIVDEENEQYLLIFFPEEIKAWNRNSKNEFVLNITQKKIKVGEFQEKIFNKNLAEKIEELLNKSEPKEYTSILVDGIFLENAIKKTIQIYSNIYPDKTFKKPDLISIIQNCLKQYNKYKTEKKIIVCSVFMSKSFNLESIVNINYENQKFETSDGNQVRIFINKTDEIIAFEILEELDRLKDNDNILLIANDRIYENQLAEHKKEGYDMIIIRSNQHDESDMYTEFRWGDISYSIGLSIGLSNIDL